MARNNASYAFQIVVKQANGQPYDLTGRSLVMQFKNTTGQNPAGTATLQTSDGSIAVQSPATAGIAVATLSLVQMQAMVQGTWFWDMLDVTTPGVPISLGAGILPVRQGITNSPTPVLPPPGLLLPGAGLDAIQVMAPGDSIQLQLAPQGPQGLPGPALAAYANNPVTGGTLQLLNTFGYVSLALVSDATILLPASPYDGQEYIVRDVLGNLSPSLYAQVAGTIDGEVNPVLNGPYARFDIRYDAQQGAWFSR